VVVKKKVNVGDRNKAAVGVRKNIDVEVSKSIDSWDVSMNPVLITGKITCMRLFYKLLL
jgi:hypothetical protein